MLACLDRPDTVAAVTAGMSVILSSSMGSFAASCTPPTGLHGYIISLAARDLEIFLLVSFFSFPASADDSGASVSAEQVMAKVAEVNQMLSGFVASSAAACSF